MKFRRDKQYVTYNDTAYLTLLKTSQLFQNIEERLIKLGIGIIILFLIIPHFYSCLDNYI